MKQTKKSQKGSITIETCIIFPITIFILIITVYIVFILYQHALLQTLVNDVSCKTEYFWENMHKDFQTGEIEKTNILKKQIYNDIYDFDKQEKVLIIKDYIKQNLDRKSILKSGYSKEEKKINVYVDNFIAYQKVKIEIQEKYNIPLSLLIKILGLKDGYTIKVSQEVIVNNPAKFIRNVDFAIKVYEENKQNLNFMQNIDDIQKKFIKSN